MTRADAGATVHSQEAGRFEFGANWKRFLSVLTDARITEAEASFGEMLSTRDLTGKRFLGIGCSSGLFSLAARRLGAIVHSFGYDPVSVASAEELKRRDFALDGEWTIARGSVLDPEYMRSLGTFNILYSWGVLHQTGWQNGLQRVRVPSRGAESLAKI